MQKHWSHGYQVLSRFPWRMDWPKPSEESSQGCREAGRGCRICLCEMKAIFLHSPPTPTPPQAIPALKTLVLPPEAERSPATFLFAYLHRIQRVRREDMCGVEATATALGRTWRSQHFRHLEDAHFLCKAGGPGLPVSRCPQLKGKCTTPHR